MKSIINLDLSKIFSILVVSIFIVFTSMSAYASDTKKVIIKFKYGSYAPHGVIDSPILWYLDEISKRSGVQIEVETYFGGTLAKPQDCLDAIGIGIYDIGWISPAFTINKTPLAIIPNSTPLIDIPLETSLKAAKELSQTFQPMAEEFKNAGTKCLFHSGVWYYNLISKKPIKNYEDIKGLRVRTYGYLAKLWAELGGTSVSIPIPEIYYALEKGVIDAVMTQPISMYKTLHISDIAKNFTKINLGCVSVPVVFNLKRWNKLPEQVRKSMIDLADEMPVIANQMINSRELEAIERMKKEGINIKELSATDMARSKEAANLISEIIVKDLESKGVVTAREAMDIYLKFINK